MTTQWQEGQEVEAIRAGRIWKKWTLTKRDAQELNEGENPLYPWPIDRFRLAKAELAKRAIACKHWRWLPGMLDEHWTRYTAEGRYPRRGVLPDLTDPATLGCLLALVREAWGDPAACVWCGSDRTYWEVTSAPMGPLPHHVLGFGSTEAEALIAALELRHE